MAVLRAAGRWRCCGGQRRTTAWLCMSLAVINTTVALRWPLIQFLGCYHIIVARAIDQLAILDFLALYKIKFDPKKIAKSISR